MKKKIRTIALICIFSLDQLAGLGFAYKDTLRPAASAKTAVSESLFKSSSVGKKPKRLKSSDRDPGIGEVIIRIINDGAETQEGFDINAERYKREFYARDKRNKVFNGLLSPDDESGVLLKKIRQKVALKRRVFRVWVPGCSTGEDLRTLIWLTRKTLASLKEDIEDWDIEFYGTDTVKNLIEEAISRVGKPDIIYSDSDREKHETVRVDIEGFNVEYLVFDHNDIHHLDNWRAWQRNEGDFDIILLNSAPEKDEVEVRIKSTLRHKGIYIVSGRVYRKVSNHDFASLVPEKNKYKADKKPTPLLLTAETVQLYLWLRFVLEKKKRTLVIFDEPKSFKVSPEDIRERNINSDNWLFWALVEKFIDKVYYFLPKDKKYRRISMIDKDGSYVPAINKEAFSGIPEDDDSGGLLFLVNNSYFAEVAEPLRENFLYEMSGLFAERRSDIEMVNLCQFQTQDVVPEAQIERNDKVVFSAFKNNIDMGHFNVVADLDSMDKWNDLAKAIISEFGVKADGELLNRGNRKKRSLALDLFNLETGSKKNSLLADSLWNERGEGIRFDKRPFNTKSSSAGSGNVNNISEDKNYRKSMRVLGGILEDRPKRVMNLGEMFNFVLKNTKILDRFETPEEKYDNLVLLVSKFEAEDFDDEWTRYIIQQTYQILLPSEPAVFPGANKLEYMIWKDEKIDLPWEGIYIRLTDVRYRRDGRTPATLKFSVFVPIKYRVVRPDREEDGLKGWRDRNRQMSDRKIGRTDMVRSFSRENKEDTIWIGGRGGYAIELKLFNVKSEADILYEKGYVCRILVRKPLEGFRPPDKNTESYKSSFAGTKDPRMEGFLVKEVNLEGNKLTAETRNGTVYELIEGHKIRESFNISPHADIEDLAPEKIEGRIFRQLLGHEDMNIVHFVLEHSERKIAEYLVELARMYRKFGDYEWSSEYWSMAVKRYLREGKHQEAAEYKEAAINDLGLLMSGYDIYYKPLARIDIIREKAVLGELLGDKLEAAKRWALASKDCNRIASKTANNIKARELYAESAFCAGNAARLNGELGREENEAKNLSFAARNWFLAEEPNKAYDAILKAIGLDRKLKNMKFEMIDMDIAANICHRLSRYEEGIGYGEGSLGLRTKLGMEPVLSDNEKEVIGKNEAGSTTLMAFSHFSNGQYTLAARYFKKALAFYRKMLEDKSLKEPERLKRRAFIVKMLSFMASSYFKDKEYRKAINCGLVAIREIESSRLLRYWNGVEKSHAMLRFTLTHSYFQGRQLEESVKHAKIGIPICERLEDKERASNLSFSAGKNLFTLGRFGESIVFLEKAVKLREGSVDYVKMAGALALKASTHVRLAESGVDALKNYKEAGLCTRRAAELNYKQGQVELAIKHYLFSERNFDEAYITDEAEYSRVKAIEILKELVSKIWAKEEWVTDFGDLLAYLEDKHSSIYNVDIDKYLKSCLRHALAELRHADENPSTVGIAGQMQILTAIASQA